MKVWQPGGHLSEERGGEVRDWSWRRTRRRIGVLARLTLPYKGRTTLALGDAPRVHARRARAAVPGEARDRRGHQGAGPLAAHLDRRALPRLPRSSRSCSRPRTRTSPAGRASACSPTCATSSSPTSQRLSLGFYERNRAGVIISRITNDVEALDQLVTDGVTSLIQNTLLLLGTAVVLFFLDVKLALATLTVLPLMAIATAWFRSRSNRAYRNVRERLGLVTATLAEDIAGMRVVQSFTREPVQQKAFHGVNDRYRAANYETVGPERDLLPDRRPARVGRNRDRLRLRRLARLPRRDERGNAVRLRALPLELLRPDPAALAALQHVPRRDRRAGQDHRRARRGAAGRRRAPTRSSCRGSRATSGSTTSASATGRSSRRCCTGSTSTSRPARPSRSSATPAPASRRSRS